MGSHPKVTLVRILSSLTTLCFIQVRSDWECPKCTFRNTQTQDQRSNQCGVCHWVRPMVRHCSPSEAIASMILEPSLSLRWICTKCTFQNSFCSMCKMCQHDPPDEYIKKCEYITTFLKQGIYEDTVWMMIPVKVKEKFEDYIRDMFPVAAEIEFCNVYDLEKDRIARSGCSFQ